MPPTIFCSLLIIHDFTVTYNMKKYILKSEVTGNVMKSERMEYVFIGSLKSNRHLGGK